MTERVPESVRSREDRARCPHCDDVPAYVLGTLDAGEARVLSKHLDAGCDECLAERDSCARAVAELDLEREESERLGPAPLPLRRRLAAALDRSAPSAQVENPWQRWTGTEGRTVAPGIVTVSGGAEWEPTDVAGIRVRRLGVDDAKRTATMIVRMDPGARYPRHRHAAREECYVLSGDVRFGDSVLRAGEFQVAAAGSIHEEQWTEEGCELLIVSSQDDERL